MTTVSNKRKLNEVERERNYTGSQLESCTLLCHVYNAEKVEDEKKTKAGRRFLL